MKFLGLGPVNSTRGSKQNTGIMFSRLVVKGKFGSKHLPGFAASSCPPNSCESVLTWYQFCGRWRFTSCISH